MEGDIIWKGWKKEKRKGRLRRKEKIDRRKRSKGKPPKKLVLHRMMTHQDYIDG